jgi:cyclophilin family peptidyl-prolyl cis-trans isomerase
MPRLGGGTYKQSYLVSGGGNSQTQTVIEERRPRSSPPSSGKFILPTTVRPESPSGSVRSTPKTRRVKAAESGTGTLLPVLINTPLLASSSASGKLVLMNRVRSFSDMSHGTDKQDSPSEAGGLRRRSTLNLDDESITLLQRRHSMSGPGLPIHNGSNSRGRSGGTTQTYLQVNTKCFTIGHLLQAMVVCVVFYLVYDAHYKVQEAAHRLEHYKQEEAMLIVQMDGVEDRAAQLQDQLTKLREDHHQATENIDETKTQTLDIHNEIHQWKREYFEVNKEVHALQDFMQDVARKELQSQYGQGAVIHVNLDLNIGNAERSQISVELFEEAPHASWVFVQQIANGDWSQANFIWHPAHMVLASPSKAASVKLEFIEKSYHHHEAWTIGLTRSHNGGYNLYVNLQDNSHVHEGDVCLGKIVGGFDTLQKLMHLETVAKQAGGEKAYLDPPIVISDITITTAKRSRIRRY